MTLQEKQQLAAQYGRELAATERFPILAMVQDEFKNFGDQYADSCLLEIKSGEESMIGIVKNTSFDSGLPLDSEQEKKEIAKMKTKLKLQLAPLHQQYEDFSIVRLCLNYFEVEINTKKQK